MNVNWMGLLGEYLLPLLVLLPLALVVLFVATRTRGKSPASQRRSESLRPRETGPVVRRSSAPWAGQMPVPRASSTRPFVDTAPMPEPPAGKAAPKTETKAPPVSMAEPVAVPWPAFTPSPVAPPPAPAPVQLDEPPAPVTAPAPFAATEPALLAEPWEHSAREYAPTEPAGLDGLHSPQADAYAATEVAGLDSPLARRFAASAAADARARPSEAYAPTQEAELDSPLARRFDPLPVADANPGLALPRRRASDRLPGPAAPADGPIPILIVDDSAVVRAKLGKLLSSNGYAVTAARHGADALEQLNRQWFSMMITDLEMPEMDGFELIEHVSGDLRTENMPVVAITGHEALQAKVQYAQGLYGIFKKPWNDRELLQRVGVLTQLRPRT